MEKRIFFVRTLAENVDTLEELNKLEEFYIEKYNCLVPNGYNVSPGGSKYRRRSNISKDQATQIILMYKEGHSTRDIGNLYGVTHYVILRILRENNVKLRDKGNKLPNRTSKVDKEKLVELYINKRMTITSIAKYFGVSRTSVRRALKRFDIKRI